ncbi:MAG: PHP domain-containing protein, partial [Clostridia bacterium]|nr:PHP domain-containing protein [Clostridia bacterium]
MVFSDDWHIHSENSCDDACMRIEDLVRDSRKKGIVEFGISDHVHTPFNYPDIAASRDSFIRNRVPGFHFGIEASCVSAWELDLIESGDVKADLTYGIRTGGPPGGPLAIGIDSEFIDSYGIEYVVAGTHWPMYVGNEAYGLVKDYHRQNMFLAQHRLVDIIAHPWWYYGPCTDCWTRDFSIIPVSMHEEFAKSCIENNKLVEINLAAMLLTANYSERFKKQYLD